MFRIRRIYDDVLPVNREAISEVRQILSSQYPKAPPGELENLGQELHDPFRQQFRTVLYVAEGARGHIMGFANVLDEPKVGFRFLEYLACGVDYTSRGIRGALYEHLRSDAIRLKVGGIFVEAFPDDQDKCEPSELRAKNVELLMLFEEFGARPIIGTKYETPLPEGRTDCLPHLVFDGLVNNEPLRASFARKAVKSILERRYGELCPPSYVKEVTSSFKKDPVQLREPRYLKQRLVPFPKFVSFRERIAMTINDQHQLHHVHERGYLEWPVRVDVIEKELTDAGFIEKIPVNKHQTKHILDVHDPELLSYLRRACAHTSEGKSVYPYVLPVRNTKRPPKELSIRAGYYCIDTFTPISRTAYPAARQAVDATLTAVEEINRGRLLAYALVRPPGHHAERKTFGGFCYFNNASIAAHKLSEHGKVAILDIDYHHGNGHQDIFYKRNDVLTVSIHGNPNFTYPYFSGFSDERGHGPGEGFNLNIPLNKSQDGRRYRRALGKAIEVIKTFRPVFLVVALGLDTARGDPTGTWLLTAKDFEENGKLIGCLQLPTLIVQEGGYKTHTLGINVRHFLQGMVSTG